MDLNIGSAARPAWYDRNPVFQQESFSDSINTNDWTQQFRFDVPSGKKAFIESLFVIFLVPSGQTNYGLELHLGDTTSLNSSLGYWHYESIIQNTSGIDPWVPLHYTGRPLREASGSFIFSVMGSGTKGTYSVNGNCKIVEFDA